MSDGARTTTLDVTLLGREYKVACPENERAELAQAVSLLDRRMREIRESSRTAGTERVAVMAALNLAHDLLRAQRAPAAQQALPIDATATRRRIDAMQAAIDDVLAAP